MIYEALWAYLHYFSIIGLVSLLVAEWLLFKPKLSLKEAKLLQRLDSLYGLASILVLGSGIIRSLYFGKGTDFYWTNVLFLSKVGLFLVVGILSIWPTVLFIKWNKSIKAGAESIELDAEKARRIKLIIRWEVILVFAIPLLAVFMSRGFGLFL